MLCYKLSLVSYFFYFNRDNHFCCIYRHTTVTTHLPTGNFRTNFGVLRLPLFELSPYETDGQIDRQTDKLVRHVMRPNRQRLNKLRTAINAWITERRSRPNERVAYSHEFVITECTAEARRGSWGGCSKPLPTS